MIKNVPIKLLKNDMLELINQKFKDKYDYFYLPIDLKTSCSVGFAFINFLHPLYLLEFFLEFDRIKWNDVMPQCRSSKQCEIVYANVQGLSCIKKQLQDKNLMKKNDKSIKPVLRENLGSSAEFQAVL